MNDGHMCYIQGRLMMLPIKKILFPSSFWGIFDFFLFFFIDLDKRIKEYYITREERVHQTYKLKAQGQDWCSRKWYSGKILQWPKVLRRKGKLLLGWRVKDANAVDRTHNGNVLRCKFNEPKEGKLGGFSYLESLKKHKRRLHWGTFFKDSLVSSKKG